MGGATWAILPPPWLVADMDMPCWRCLWCLRLLPVAATPAWWVHFPGKGRGGEWHLEQEAWRRLAWRGKGLFSCVPLPRAQPASQTAPGVLTHDKLIN